MLKIKRLRPDAVLPAYGSPFAAGLDLAMPTGAESVELLPGERLLVKTGIAVVVPEGHYGRIAPRSGLAYKSGIDVMAGVVDEDYRGDVGVILINLGQSKLTVNPGDRIAQFIVERISRPEIVEVDELDDTQRGEGGFGSTGIKAVAGMANEDIYRHDGFLGGKPAEKFLSKGMSPLLPACFAATTLLVAFAFEPKAYGASVAPAVTSSTGWPHWMPFVGQNRCSAGAGNSIDCKDVE